jgi:WD40 repeat protein
MELKHNSPLIGCRFDPSGRFLFVTAQDNSIQRYDLATGRKTALLGHSSWSRGLGFVGKATQVLSLGQGAFGHLAGGLAGSVSASRTEPCVLISGDYKGELRWWDATAETPTPTRTLIAHDGWVRAVAMSPDSTTIASCGNDRLVKLWSSVDGKAIRAFEGHGSHVYNVAFHPDGKRLVSADLKGTLKEWDVATGKPLREFDGKLYHKYDPTFAADIGGVRGMSFSADGKTLATTGITNVSNAFAGVGNPQVVLFDMADGKPRPLKLKDAFQGTGWGVGLLPSGYVVAAGGAGQGRIWFWKPDDVTSVHMVNVPTNARDLAVHPDGTAFAIAGANGSAFVYTLTPAAKSPVPATPAKKK